MPRSRRPKLGQHFLTSEGHRQRIAQSLDLRSDDLVIEIGAGRGAMTRLLAERARRVLALELDPALAATLVEAFRAEPRVEILQADILATDVAALCRRYESERCFIFGNLPYYITSPIIHHLMGYADCLRGLALVVQREVAERLTADPGSRAYGYLSVLAQLHSQPRVVFSIPPGAFSPPPKIVSALVSFDMRPKFPSWPPERRARLLDFAKRSFAKKRKNVLNNLAGTYGRESVLRALAALDLSPKARAEELALAQLAGLLEHLEGRR